MRRILFFFIIVFLFIYNINPQDQINEKRWVNAEIGLNMRKEPNLKSKIITLLKYGTEVVLLDKKQDIVIINNIKGKWSKIEYNNKIGWVFGGYLTKDKIIKNEVNQNIYKILIKDDIEDLKNKIKYFIKKPVKKLEYFRKTYNNNFQDYIDETNSYYITIINFTEEDHTLEYGFTQGEVEIIDYLKQRDEYLSWQDGFKGNSNHSEYPGEDTFIIKKIGNIKYELIDYYVMCWFRRQYIYFTKNRKIVIDFCYASILPELEEEDKMFDSDGETIIYYKKGKRFLEIFEDFASYIGNFIYQITKE